MSSTEHLLTTKWERIARVYSRNHGVRVELTGGRCDTDGDVIRIPANADHFAEADQAVLEGLVDHEWLHVHEERAAKERGGEGALAILGRLAKEAPKERGLFNSFEDVRIEAVGAERWRGVGENLKRASDFTLDLLRKRIETAPETTDPLHLVGCAMYAAAKRRSVDWLPDDLRWIFDARLRDLAEEAAAGIADPAHAERLARETARRVRDLLPEVEEECRRREEGDGEEEPSEGGAEGGAGKGASVEAPTRPAGASGSAPSPSPEEGGDRPAGASGSAEPGDDVKALPGPLLEAVRDELRKAGEADTTTDPVFGLTAEHIEGAAADDRRLHRRWCPHPAVKRLDELVRPEGSTRAYLEAREEIGPQVRTLRAKLSAVLRARALDRLSCDQEHGMLDDGALYSLRTGNKRVFMERRKGHPIDTAVEILVDLSGSMGMGRRSRSFYARLTAVALSEAMEALQIPFEVLGFTNPHRGPFAFEGGDEPELATWSRWLPFRFTLVKGWDENLRACRGRFGAINAEEENVDGEAVLFAAKRLAQRNETRKILFVLSDGDPLGGGRRPEMRAHLLEVVKRVARAQIEVFGIGMQTRAVATFYNAETHARHAVINELDQLAVQVFRMFKKTMVEGEAHDATSSATP